MAIKKLAAPLGALLLAVLLGGGCISSRPPVLIKEYALDYRAPKAAPRPGRVTLKLKRLASALACRGPEMVFHTAPYARESYYYHRWQQAPADMATDLILRDLRGSSLFRAVSGPDQARHGGLLLSGGVEAFHARKRGGAFQAVCVLTFTLEGTLPGRARSGVIWQKTYTQVQNFSQKGATGFARAMSAAMSRVSARLIKDIAAALKRLPGKGGV